MDKKFNLDAYKKAKDGMVAANASAYDITYNRYTKSRIRDYTLEDVQHIIQSGSLEAQKQLSRNYFYKDGFYKRIVLYYATLLKYIGILVPDIPFTKTLDNKYILKHYNQALNMVEKMNLPVFLTNCAIKAYTDGTYYGIIQKMDKNSFVVLDLPSMYCDSRFKDLDGNHIIEFDLTYFDLINSELSRQAALNSFPKIIVEAYDRWRNNQGQRWIFIPSDVGICFPFSEDGRPPFINIIPSTMQYEKAVETDQIRDADEVKKILVQKVPHLSDGELLFEPEEAEQMHLGAVGMLKNNSNVSVLTTYTDVSAIVSKTGADTANSTLERMLQNIYSNTGVSPQIFSSTGSSTLEQSIDNDISYAMVLANKFSTFVSSIIDRFCGNGNISFKYNILPVSQYNQQKYVDLMYKLANSGYSFLMPAIAGDLSQKDLVNIKNLENKVLKLSELLVPLSSAYTGGAQASDSSAGRPELEEKDKSDKTIKNEESLDKQSKGGKK